MSANAINDYLTNGAMSLLEKPLTGVNDDRKAVVRAAVSANISLAILGIEYAGAKLLVGKYPKLAATIEQLTGLDFSSPAPAAPGTVSEPVVTASGPVSTPQTLVPEPPRPADPAAGPVITTTTGNPG